MLIISYRVIGKAVASFEFPLNLVINFYSLILSDISNMQYRISI